MWTCSPRLKILNIEDQILSASFHLWALQWWEDHMIDFQTIEWAHGLELLRDFSLLILISLHSKVNFKMLCKEIDFKF